MLSVEPGTTPASPSTRADGRLVEFVRMCTYYYAQYGWLPDDELIGNVGRLADIPGVLVHGRLDLSCPVDTAYELANAWPGAQHFVCDESGHRGSTAKRAYLFDALAGFARGALVADGLLGADRAARPRCLPGSSASIDQSVCLARW